MFGNPLHVVVHKFCRQSIKFCQISLSLVKLLTMYCGSHFLTPFLVVGPLSKRQENYQCQNLGDEIHQDFRFWHVLFHQEILGLVSKLQMLGFLMAIRGGSYMCVDTCECRGLSHLIYHCLIVFVTFTCIIEYIYVYRYGFVINSAYFEMLQNFRGVCFESRS